MREKKREEPRSFGHRNLKRIRHHKADSRWKEIEVPKKEITISLADAQIRQESGFWTKEDSGGTSSVADLHPQSSCSGRGCLRLRPILPTTPERGETQSADPDA